MRMQELRTTLWRLLGAAATWHVTSQQHARRNALVASTELVQRRHELWEVEQFLELHAVRHPDARAARRTA